MIDQTTVSTADERMENNTMRHVYRTLSDKEKAQIEAIKTAGDDLLNAVVSIGQSRELSLSRTKIEEAVFWAVKHVTA